MSLEKGEFNENNGKTSYRQYEFELRPDGKIIYREDVRQQQLEPPDRKISLDILENYDSLTYHQRALRRFSDLIGILKDRLEPERAASSVSAQIIQFPSQRNPNNKQ